MSGPAVVSIYCADISHPRKRVSVETFARADELTGWDLITKTTSTAGRTVLNGSTVIADQGVTVAEAEASDRRVGYTIRCPRCGLDASARRESITAILDAVIDHSTETNAAGMRVSSVPLSWLAAKMSSSK